MPTEIKPFFRPDSVRPELKGFDPSPPLLQKLANWSNLLGSKQAGTMKETELLPDFIRDVFVDLLGYVPPPSMPYTLKREALVESTARGSATASTDFPFFLSHYNHMGRGHRALTIRSLGRVFAGAGSASCRAWGSRTAAAAAARDCDGQALCRRR